MGILKNKNVWVELLRLAGAIITALLTTLGTTSCMGLR